MKGNHPYFNKVAYLLIVCTAVVHGAAQLPTWHQRHQSLLQKAVKTSFAGIPLQDIKEVEADIISLGESVKIKHWKFKFDQFKIKLSILKEYIQKNFTIREWTPEELVETASEPFPRFRFEFIIRDWFPLLGLLGLKPVTAEEQTTFTFKPYIEKFSRPWETVKGDISAESAYKYDESSIAGHVLLTLVTKPLIPLSKMMEWYDSPEFLDLPKSVFEGRASEFEKIHQQLQKMAKNDDQDDTIAMMWRWAELFSGSRSENQTALFLGYQPYAYIRATRGVGGRDRAFYAHQDNYRFLLNPEMVYLDDTRPYTVLDGRIMEYLFRTSLGDELYLYIVASKIFENVVMPVYRTPTSSPRMSQFLLKNFQIKDLVGFNPNRLDLSDMAFFIKNFLAGLSLSKGQKETKIAKAAKQ